MGVGGLKLWYSDLLFWNEEFYEEEECCRGENHQVPNVAATNELLCTTRCQGITNK